MLLPAVNLFDTSGNCVQVRPQQTVQSKQTTRSLLQRPTLLFHARKKTVALQALAPIHHPWGLRAGLRKCGGSAGKRRKARAAASGEESGGQLAPEGQKEERGNLVKAANDLMKLQQKVTDLESNGVESLSQEQKEELVHNYRTALNVFYTCNAFFLADLIITTPLFAIALTALNVSGRGYSDLLAMSVNVAPLHDILEKSVDPTVGNVATVFLLLDLVGPLVLPAAALLTPRTKKFLGEWYEEQGYGVEGQTVLLERKLGLAAEIDTVAESASDTL